MTVGRVLVIVPTYNERDNLEIIAGRLHAAVPAADLLVVDDNSPDGTGRIADTLAGEQTWASVLHRTGKQGLGAAYIAGFGWARERGYDVVVEMDADGCSPASVSAIRPVPSGLLSSTTSRSAAGTAVCSRPAMISRLSRSL